MPMIYDSAIFGFITYQILLNSSVERGTRSLLRAFCGRGFLPVVSRNLLHSGQHFYLIAICGNIVLLVMIKVPNAPTVYRGMCSVPVLAITNAMACTVYRRIKFGLISPDGTVNYNTFGSFHAGEYSTRNSLPLQFHQDTARTTVFKTFNTETQLSIGIHSTEDQDTQNQADK
ncbi:hypothetical protein VKT23_016170 [Stygiomarasmius scandens]|uniref:Uncharacterized protein n=1 Tax=Marasmiellus scandens TaxID=2682957 RepID=A0ABR1IXM8_9AGAR